MREIRHDLNEIAQMYVGAEFHLGQNDIKQAMDCIKRAKEITESVESRLETERLLKEVDELSAMIDSEQEEYNHAKESGDVDYSAGEGNSNILRSGSYEY